MGDLSFEDLALSKPGLNPFVGLHLLAGVYCEPFQYYYCRQHGIVLPSGLIACETTSDDGTIDVRQSRVVELTSDRFAANGQVCACVYPYDRIAAARRAASLVGRCLTGTFARTGDNFAIWCVNGTPLQVDSDTFGQQLFIARGLGLYQHHGIGIEHRLVVHFNKRPDSIKPVVHLASMDEFEGGGRASKVRQENRLHPLHTRNLAVNLLGAEGYDLTEANCEHLASYCVTGRWCSTQVEQAVKRAKWGGATLMKLAIAGMAHMAGQPGAARYFLMSDALAREISGFTVDKLKPLGGKFLSGVVQSSR